ncbi:hypothetical protein [Streptomyces sp. NPDC001450]
MPGDDGRFHLERRGRMLRGDTVAAGGWSHRQHCGWIDSGSGTEEWRGGIAPDSLVRGSPVAEWVYARPARA